MIAVVTGYPRSGTSMMMQALIAGGLDGAYDDARDQILVQTGDDTYQANPVSLYEIDFSAYARPDFPAAYEGRLIKVFPWGLPALTPDRTYRIVAMTRDEEERRQSFVAMGSRFGRWAVRDVIPIPTLVADLQVRLGAVVSVVDYATAVADPLGTFHRLVDDGWGIDPVAAAAVVNPAWYRFRRERLTVGIV